MAERIGIVTGGGDCPGLNAVIRAVAKAAAKRGWETVGFLGGYEGMLAAEELCGLITRTWAICSPAAARFWARPTAGDSPPRPVTARAGGSPRS